MVKSTLRLVRAVRVNILKDTIITLRGKVILQFQKIQLLVNKYASHGKLVYNKNGQWSKKEIIVSDDYVGYAVNSKAKTEQITKSFKIHYSNKGVHIVPREE